MSFISALGTIVSADVRDHWRKHNHGVSYVEEIIFDQKLGQYKARLTYSPDGMTAMPKISELADTISPIHWIETIPYTGMSPPLDKNMKFTAEEMRQMEDGIKKEIDDKDELRQAMTYAYLNGLGWRMTQAQHMIDKAMK